MGEYIHQRGNLQFLLDEQWKNYRKAIKDDKPFKETKIIYLRIKKLKTELTEVSNKIREQLNLGD